MKKGYLVAAMTLVMGLPLLAQEKPAAPPDNEGDPVAAAKSAQTPQALLRMANDIRKQILSLPEYGVFDDISFGIKDYSVTLKGSASRPILKSSAEKVTQKVEGVKGVTNEIEVQPLSPMDDRIRARVYASIYYHPTLSRYNPNRGVPPWITPGRMAAGITNDPPFGWHPIHIIVKNGNVRLTGVVDNEGDKQIAGIQANTVSGVFSVENDIMVTAKPPKQKKQKS